MTSLYQDTFTGIGSLGTHSADVGGSYTLYSGAGGVLTDMVLNGTGGLNANAVATDHPATINLASTLSVEFTTEIKFKITGNPSPGYITISGTDYYGGMTTTYLQVLDAGEANGVGLTITDGDPADTSIAASGKWFINGFNTNGSPGGLNFFFVPTGGTQTLQLICNSTGYSIVLDGAVLGSELCALPTSLTHIIMDRALRNGVASDVVTLDSLEVRTGAGTFWSVFRNTVELDA